MQGHLPIPVFPTQEIVRILRRGGVKVSVDRALSVKRVFYLGDQGGIACDVTPRHDAKERSLSSRSHTCELLRITHSAAPSSLISFSESDASQPRDRRRSMKPIRVPTHYLRGPITDPESRVLNLDRREAYER
jgi:hypothetical protein